MKTFWNMFWHLAVKHVSICMFISIHSGHEVILLPWPLIITQCLLLFWALRAARAQRGDIRVRRGLERLPPSLPSFFLHWRSSWGGRGETNVHEVSDQWSVATEDPETQKPDFLFGLRTLKIFFLLELAWIDSCGSWETNVDLDWVCSSILRCRNMI